MSASNVPSAFPGLTTSQVAIKDENKTEVLSGQVGCDGDARICGPGHVHLVKTSTASVVIDSSFTLAFF